MVFPSHPSKCWRCLKDPSTFLHGLWDCADISKFVQPVTTSSVPLSIDVCILGLIYLLATSRALRTLIGFLLFYARKTILYKWKSPQAPTLDFWKSTEWCHYQNLPMSRKDALLNSPRCGISEQNPRILSLPLYRPSR